LVILVAGEKLVAILHTETTDDAVGRNLQDRRDLGQVDLRMIRGHQQAIEADIIDALRLREDVAIDIEEGAARRGDRLLHLVIGHRHAPVHVVLDQLNLDQIKRDDREPAGEHDQNPDGARAVLHDISELLAEPVQRPRPSDRN